MARYLMDGMLSVSMTDSPSFRQTDRKQRSGEVANRGVKLEEGVITIITGMLETN